MRRSHPVESAVGIEWYVSDGPGTGGRLRDRTDDFRVREREAFDVDVRPPSADPGSYPHLVFRATLRGWDTNDFASALSDRLGISRERISWAGTKDKRGVTTQLFSVRLDQNTLPEIDRADVDVLGRAGRPVLFGDLAGNDFEIVVREPDEPNRADRIASELRRFAADSDVRTARTVDGLDTATDDGTDSGEQDADDPGADEPEVDKLTTDEPIAVPNYFGQQRFGSKRPITHRVGLDIVRGNWGRAAVRYVTESSDREPDGTRRARDQLAETRSWADASSILPGGLRYERAIADRLADGADGPADYRESLERLPTNLQQLLVNAAQSYVFNRILSERLDRRLPFGRPVAGDVVCFADERGLPDPDRSQVVDENRVDVVTRHCERGRAFVTAPLVGTDTEFGAGEPAAIARAVLADLGVERGDFDLPGAFGSSGTRRAIRVETAIEIRRNPLNLSFSLPKGSYATVLAREFLKVDPDLLA
ncbi:MAG: tRNA pseudouridine(13) synthase TruD [Natronomonas sp.]